MQLIVFIEKSIFFNALSTLSLLTVVACLPALNNLLSSLPTGWLSIELELL